MAEVRLKDYFGKEKYEIIDRKKGSELQGIEYVPLFDFFIDRQKDGCFRVVAANFVTDSDGTGIVHCAPGLVRTIIKSAFRKSSFLQIILQFLWMTMEDIRNKCQNMKVFM